MPYLFVSSVGGLGDRFFLIQLKHCTKSVMVLYREKVRWRMGEGRGAFQPFHSQAFCLSKAGFRGRKSEQHNSGFTAAVAAGLYRSSRFCCTSRRFARQRWIIEPLQGKAQLRSLTQTGAHPGASVGCKVCKGLGQAAHLPELFWSSLSLSKGNFRKEGTPACSAQSSIPWERVREQLCCYTAQPIVQ